MEELNLTFGIELEFLCLRPNTIRDCAGKVIFDVMKEKGVPVTGYEELEDDIKDTAPSYSRWSVKDEDLDLTLSEEVYLPAGWMAEPVEMSSRKFNFFGEDWRSEIASVLKIIRGIEETGCRFITNESTGLHVHVGNGDRRSPLRLAKRVFQFVTAFERCIDELHPAWRIAIPDPIVYRHYSYPPSFFHVEGKPGVGRSPSFFARLAKIEEIDSYEAMGAFGCVPIPDDPSSTTGHNTAYNFDNLFAKPEHGRFKETLTGTIEFRQHRGTLDFLEIISWVLLTCRIVTFCQTSSFKNRIDLFSRGIDPHFKLRDLLLALGCSKDIQDHYSGEGLIGIIGEPGVALPLTPDTLHAIIAQNDEESEDHVDPIAVQAVIKHKTKTGLYGIDPNASSIEAVSTRDLLMSDTRRAETFGYNLDLAEGSSRAAAQVLWDLARRV